LVLRLRNDRDWRKLHCGVSNFMRLSSQSVWVIKSGNSDMGRDISGTGDTRHVWWALKEVVKTCWLLGDMCNRNGARLGPVAAGSQVA